MKKLTVNSVRALLIGATIVAGAFASASVQTPVERKLYVGAGSHEATLEFDGKVELFAQNPPDEARSLSHIQRQVEHLFGPMGERHGNPVLAVPKTDHKITNIQIAKIGSHSYRISYRYSGTIVVEDGVETYKVALPTNPQSIFKLGLVGEDNPCTDHHYQSEGDFWYFWSPSRPGCQLKEGKDYQTFVGTLKAKKNSARTYPEYERMVSNGVIRMSLLMGMDDPGKEADPNKSSDINASNFRQIKETLLSEGYASSGKWTPAQVAKIVTEDYDVKPYVETFTKKVDGPHGKITLSVRIFFGPSGIDEDSEPFHYFLRDSLKNDAVMAYAGHSGLGGHLSLKGIEANTEIDLTPDASKYQIYYFNSCSSYPYYGDQYFARKGGTKNLDIITNGLATYFHVMPDTNLTIIRAIESWASGKGRLSYQALAASLDTSNLLGINGDEDNPKK